MSEKKNLLSKICITCNAIPRILKDKQNKIFVWYACKLRWLFRSCLLKSHHASWTSGRVLMPSYFFVLQHLSQGLITPQLDHAPQMFNSGLKMRLCEGRFDNEFFSNWIFGISKLFQTQKSFWSRFKTNSFWRNSSDSYGEVLEVMKAFYLAFGLKMKWHLVGHKKFKFQFEG